MKIKLSKSQWEMMGKKAGWMKTAISDWEYDSAKHCSNSSCGLTLKDDIEEVDGKPYCPSCAKKARDRRDSNLGD